MADNEIGFAIVGVAGVLWLVFATLKIRLWCPYLLTAAITAVVVRMAAWAFSWRIVAAFWVPLVILLILPVPKDEPRPKGSRFYLYRGGDTARRIRFDDEGDDD